MEGLKKNPDRMNTIGIVTVGLTGAALVYLSIIGIEAWYLNETSAVDQVAKFGKQAEQRKALKAEQIGKITEPRLGVVAPNGTQLYTIGIDAAKDLIVRDAATPDHFVPAVGLSDHPTIQPAFGRPVQLVVAPPATPTDGATPVAPTDGATPTPGAATPGAATPGTPAPTAGAPAPTAGAPAPTPAGSAPAPTGGAATPTGATGTPAPAPAGSTQTAPAAGGH